MLKGQNVSCVGTPSSYQEFRQIKHSLAPARRGLGTARKAVILMHIAHSTLIRYGFAALPCYQPFRRSKPDIAASIRGGILSDPLNCAWWHV